MDKCPYCDSPIDASNPVFLLTALEKLSWDSMESDSDRYGYPVGKRFPVAGLKGEAEVVAKKVKYDGNRYYHDEIPQGTEFETFIVLRVGDHHFRKTGSGDSYGNVTWDGPVKPVTPRTKTITIYDYEEDL